MVCLSVYNQINLDLNTLFLLSKLQLLSFCPAKSQVSLKGTTNINATSLCLLWLVIQREKLIKDHDEVMQYRKTVKHNISITVKWVCLSQESVWEPRMESGQNIFS